MTEKQWVRKPGQDVLGSTPRLVYAVPPVLQCLKHAGKTPPVVYSVLLKVTVDISLASFPIVLILGDNWALIVLKDWASQCPRTWWLFFSKSIKGKIQNLLFYKTELETIIRAWKTFQTELQSNTIMKFKCCYKVAVSSFTWQYCETPVGFFPQTLLSLPSQVPLYSDLSNLSPNHRFWTHSPFCYSRTMPCSLPPVGFCLTALPEFSAVLPLPATSCYSGHELNVIALEVFPNHLDQSGHPVQMEWKVLQRRFWGSNYG